MQYLLLIAIINAFTCTFALQNVFEYEINDFEEQLDNTMNKKLDNFYKYVGAMKSDEDRSDEKNVKLQPFSWKDCGTPTAVLKIKSLTISPSPIKDPITISARFSVKENLVSPLKAKVNLKKKIGFIWFHVPCVYGLGSCTYDDVCQFASHIKQCPEQFEKIGIDCKCPLKAKSYILPKTQFHLDIGKVPSGDYKFEVSITQNNVEAACLYTAFSVA